MLAPNRRVQDGKRAADGNWVLFPGSTGANDATTIRKRDPSADIGV
jgi:hypothetical protein